MASQIASEVQPENYVFKNKGDEQQFNFNRKVIRTSTAVVKALESGNIGKAKEELNEGISLLTNRQKIIKLADKSEFGWATVQEHVCDDLVDDEADVSKIKKAAKRAAAKFKSFQEKKRSTNAKFSTSAPSPSNASRFKVCRVSSFLLMLVIFIPKVDTWETFSEAPICVFDVRREVTGPVPAILKMNSCPQDANLDFLDLDQYEFDQSEQGIVGSSFIQGKLHANLSFRASDFVLDMIESSHKILFQETPLPYSIENRSSAFMHRRFVQEAVSELQTHGCTREVSVYPRFAR